MLRILTLEEIEALDPISQRKYIQQAIDNLLKEYKKLIEAKYELAIKPEGR